VEWNTKNQLTPASTTTPMPGTGRAIITLAKSNGSAEGATQLRKKKVAKKKNRKE